MSEDCRRSEIFARNSHVPKQPKEKKTLHSPIIVIHLANKKKSFLPLILKILWYRTSDFVMSPCNLASGVWASFQKCLSAYSIRLVELSETKVSSTSLYSIWSHISKNHDLEISHELSSILYQHAHDVFMIFIDCQLHFGFSRLTLLAIQKVNAIQLANTISKHNSSFHPQWLLTSGSESRGSMNPSSLARRQWRDSTASISWVCISLKIYLRPSTLIQSPKDH